MAELQWPGQPEQPSLRRALRHAIRRQRPELRVIAEDFLAETTKIDLLAIGRGGELVSIRIGDERAEATLFTRGLADLSWLRPRAFDLLKLAPGLGLEPSTEPRSMVCCTRFGSETRAAAENLPACSLELVEYRCLRHQGQLTLLLESSAAERWATGPSRGARSADPSGSSRADRRPDSPLQDASSTVRPLAGSDGSRPLAPRGLTDPPSPTTFRTGLTDADLRSGRTGELAST